MKIMGLDLSITATGIAYPDGSTAVVRTNQKHGDRRLAVIVDRLKEAPDLAVIEDLPTHAHGAGITGMVHGAVRLALMEAGVRYVLVPPATLKAYATGRGNAGKPQMAVAAFERAGAKFADDNQCDAAWLRWMGLDHYGEAEFVLPKAQRARMDAVVWP